MPTTRLASPIADRVLAAVGRHGDLAVEGAAIAFRRFILIEAAAQSWIVVVRGNTPQFHQLLLLCAVFLSMSAAAAFFRSTEKPAAVFAFLVMVGRIGVTFPDAYNHLVMEALLTGAAALTQPRDRGEQVLMLQSARWLIVIVLFWSGMQKVLHGCYFRGEFLALAMTANPHFGGVLSQWFAADLDRLRALGPLAIGAGPYRIDSVAFVALSNLVWMSELLLAASLLLAPFRFAAAIAGIILVVAIELVARELVFGLLFINGLLLFTPGDLYRRAVPWLSILLAGIAAAEIAFPTLWLN